MQQIKLVSWQVLSQVTSEEPMIPSNMLEREHGLLTQLLESMVLVHRVLIQALLMRQNA
jgi:hypothetical protein